MEKTTVIKKVNRKALEFIKQEISNRKERHTKMIQSINPNTIAVLKSTKKIG